MFTNKGRAGINTFVWVVSLYVAESKTINLHTVRHLSRTVLLNNLSRNSGITYLSQDFYNYSSFFALNMIYKRFFRICILHHKVSIYRDSQKIIPGQNIRVFLPVNEDINL